MAYMFLPGSAYVRVSAQDETNDPSQTSDMDVDYTLPVDSTSLAEAESNDVPADPQDLGIIGPTSVLVLDGGGSAAGHDGLTFLWDGDLDYYTFEVSADFHLNMQLLWEDNASTDMDALIFDASAGTPILASYAATFGTVGMGAAASGYIPEYVSDTLYTNTPYVLFVAGREGASSPYEETLACSAAF